MNKASRLLNSITERDEDIGFLLNKLFPTINNSPHHLRAERISGKPNSLLVKDGSNEFLFSIKKIK